MSISSMSETTYSEVHRELSSRSFSIVLFLLPLHGQKSRGLVIRVSVIFWNVAYSGWGNREAGGEGLLQEGYSNMMVTLSLLR